MIRDKILKVVEKAIDYYLETDSVFIYRDVLKNVMLLAFRDGMSYDTLVSFSEDALMAVKKEYDSMPAPLDKYSEYEKDLPSWFRKEDGFIFMDNDGDTHTVMKKGNTYIISSYDCDVNEVCPDETIGEFVFGICIDLDKYWSNCKIINQ